MKRAEKHFQKRFNLDRHGKIHATGQHQQQQLVQQQERAQQQHWQQQLQQQQEWIQQQQLALQQQWNQQQQQCNQQQQQAQQQQDQQQEHRHTTKDALGGNLRTVTLYPNVRDKYEMLIFFCDHKSQNN